MKYSTKARYATEWSAQWSKAGSNLLGAGSGRRSVPRQPEGCLAAIAGGVLASNQKIRVTFFLVFAARIVHLS